MTKILSVEELIKHKATLKQDDEKVMEKTLFITRLQSEIKLSFNKKDVRDFLDVTNTKTCTDEQAEAAGLNLIYSIISEPNLKDKDLQKAYECVEPTDIVSAIFTDGEMLDISNFAIKEAGFQRGSISVVEDLKN